MLTADKLWYAKPQLADRNVTSIPLPSSACCNVVGDRLFRVTAHNRTYVLRAETQQEMYW